ncbi:hypothetical protein ACF0H5_005756 [Mactra antiquata]
MWSFKALIITASFLLVFCQLFSPEMELHFFLDTQHLQLPTGAQILSSSTNASMQYRRDGYIDYKMSINGMTCTLLLKAEYVHMFLMQAVGPPSYHVVEDTCGITTIG